MFKDFINKEWREKWHRAGNVCLILILGLSVSLLMSVNLDQIPKALEVGSIATKDIKADQNYEIVDEKSTEKLRQEAADSVLPLFDFDPTVEVELVGRIGNAFKTGREFLKTTRPAKGGGKLSAEVEEEIKKSFATALGAEAPEKTYKVLRGVKFHPVLESALISLIRSQMKMPIILSKEELTPFAEKGFVLRRLGLVDKAEEVVREFSMILSLEEARKKMTARSRRSLERPLSLEFLDHSAFETLKEMAQGILKSNVIYSGLESEARKLKAQATIKNIIIKIKRGESIIRDGDHFEPWHLTVIDGIRLERMRTNRWLKFAGTFLFVNLVLLVVYFYASRYIRKFSPNRGDLVFLGFSLIFFLSFLRVGVFMSETVRDALPFVVGESTLYYAIPIAGGAMLVRFMLNSETALIFAVVLSLFSGVFIENSLEMTVYFLISGVFAAHVIARVEKRSSVLLCGVYTGIVCALTVLSLKLLGSVTVSENISLPRIALNMSAGFLGGLSTSMLVLILTPLCEVLFNYTTDIKLMELANMSHPLLKEMIVRAPGTYHHSQLVGILSEAAASEIGANPLLARVACYYHDIGKMKKPQYFIENQAGGENAHDRLNPSMSALIIESHVKDGIEMAREYKLPQKIADMIPQHQGTKLMGYFYNKAKKMADPALGEVDEKDYRYPGPKPQTREAGVIMLADTVEAATRALPEKTPQKIQATVEKLVNQHFVDEQLDECDLTLRDLHKIAGSFVKILVGIYHQRVEYPEGALLSESQIQSLLGQSGLHDLGDFKRDSVVSNIAPLFRKRDKKNPSTSGA